MQQFVEREILVHVVDIMRVSALPMLPSLPSKKIRVYYLYHNSPFIEKNPLKIRSHPATGFVLPMASAFDNMIQLQLEEKGWETSKLFRTNYMRQLVETEILAFCWYYGGFCSPNVTMLAKRQNQSLLFLTQFSFKLHMRLQNEWNRYLQIRGGGMQSKIRGAS